MQVPEKVQLLKCDPPFTRAGLLTYLDRNFPPTTACLPNRAKAPRANKRFSLDLAWLYFRTAKWKASACGYENLGFARAGLHFGCALVLGAVSPRRRRP